tara:strand:- start:154 stop:321 length:168 start_codon:yes stop_codon:yes gene_type:complete
LVAVAVAVVAAVLALTKKALRQILVEVDTKHNIVTETIESNNRRINEGGNKRRLK